MYDSYAVDSANTDFTLAAARQQLARHRRNLQISRLIVIVTSLAAGGLAKSHPLAALPFSLICICAVVMLIVEFIRMGMTVRAIKASRQASVSPLVHVNE